MKNVKSILFLVAILSLPTETTAQGRIDKNQELNQLLAYARSNTGIRNSNYRKLPQFKENILLTIAGNCCFK